ncbi:Uncharacterised protein [Mycobacteroides abscessus subsp. abscessus]|nr:Uncharacterised protein [Mycobacteroides abscessus subsp. abscessus]
MQRKTCRTGTQRTHLSAQLPGNPYQRIRDITEQTGVGRRQVVQCEMRCVGKTE